MRLSAVLLCCSLAGVVGGAALIAPWAVGCAIIVDSIALGLFAWLRETESRPGPSVAELPTVAQILERNRAS